MSVVVALVSQKGGVGKSTLARGLGALGAHAGLSVRIADLDPEQATVVEWEAARREQAVKPKLDVQGYDTVEEALEEADDVELLILDAPGRADQSTLAIAEHAHLVVQPTGPSRDDLYPGVLLFHELVRKGIKVERLIFALCRTQSKEEEANARAYLAHAGYAVLPGALPERAGYREAQNQGRAITETSRKDLNDRADALMLELLKRVAGEVEALRGRQKDEAKKGKREGAA